MRQPLEFIAWKSRKAVGPELRAIYRAQEAIYRAQEAEAGLAALEAFKAGPWGAKYPAVAPAWRASWDRAIPFFALPEAVRRIVDTTNTIQALNSTLRRAVRAREHFPSDEPATKWLHLVLNRAAANWTRPPREWVNAQTQFAITFGEQFRISAMKPAPAQTS